MKLLKNFPFLNEKASCNFQVRMNLIEIERCFLLLLYTIFLLTKVIPLFPSEEILYPFEGLKLAFFLALPISHHSFLSRL